MLRLHCIKQGRGPFVVLSHALGVDLHMWDAVANVLTDRYTVLRYDHRGHGRSEVVPGPYRIEMLADDAASLIRVQCDEPVHFVGLSLGGMTAQSLAIRAPELLASVTIVNSADHYADPAPWHARMQLVHTSGVSAITEGTLDRWLTPGFRATPEGAAVEDVLRARLLSANPVGFLGACEAIVALDLREGNRRIALPALVVAGSHDSATTPSMARQIAGSIPGARLELLDAAHLSAAERPAELSELISSFIQDQSDHDHASMARPL